MSSAAPIAVTALEEARPRVSRSIVLSALVGVSTFACGEARGSYEITEWPLLGIGILVAAWLLAAVGRRASRLALASGGALAALGAWTVASVAWGGTPNWAWVSLDQWLVAAAALVLGTLLGRRYADAAAAGVLLGIAAQSAYVLGRTAISGVATGWFDGRVLDGPVGYHNAQGALFAVGLPLAIRELSTEARLRRAAGAVSATSLTGALLLTQSRGALAAGILGAGVVLSLVRSLGAFIRTLALAGAGGVLVWKLQAVDSSLFRADRGDILVALRTYALTTVACAAAVAAVACVRLEIRVTKSIRLVLALALVAAALSAAAVGRVDRRAASIVRELRSDTTPQSQPGATRFTSLSLNGRLAAWRIAAHMFEAAPILGKGSGQFSRTWTEKRTTPALYILQPHSIELELASETGLVGLGLFAAFAALLAAALARAAGRKAVAAAAGSCVALVAQASFDWTWSFPGLVAPVLLVAGAVASPRIAPRSCRGMRFAGTAILALALAAVFLVPYAADRARRQGASLAARDPSGAWSRAAASARLDPWDPDTVELEAALAQSAGSYRLAAAKYLRAARLSSHPWLDDIRAADAFRRAGLDSARLRECRAAARSNPLEPLVAQGSCSLGS